MIVISLFGVGVNLIIKNQPQRIEYLSDKYEKINLNQAGIDDFCLVPGIGEKISQAIIEYRNRHGRFKKLEELKEVKGIGKAKYAIFKDYFFIE